VESALGLLFWFCFLSASYFFLSCIHLQLITSLRRLVVFTIIVFFQLDAEAKTIWKRFLTAFLATLIPGASEQQSFDKTPSVIGDQTGLPVRLRSQVALNRWTGMLSPGMGIVKKKANGDCNQRGKGVRDLWFSDS
jgi:hypothetical protein